MNFNITTLLQQVDKFGNNYVSQAYQNLASALTGGGQVGVAGLMLTLYVIFWAISIWQGTSTGSGKEMVWRLFRAFVIYALATGWGDFQTYAYSFANETPSAIGNSLLTSVSANVTGTSAGLNSVNSVQTALQNIWDSLANSTSAFIKSLGVLNFGGYVLAAIILVVGALLIGYAIFLIILSKIFLWLLLALAPVFIILMLFGYTTRFFAGWITAIVQYMCVQILVYAFCAFFISITQTYFDAVNRSNGAATTTLTEAAPLILICLVGVLLLSQITNVAASLAGGIGIGTPSFGRFYGGAFGSMGQASQRTLMGRMGWSTRQERLAGRERARVSLAQRRYENSAEYARLSRKLTDPA
ncbi:conjugal transfer protein TrbL [Mesorhizobium erdmanii]|uniref:Conjugal transfer protein TrbL n=2 Tax=Mesorhizobium TaxID=68287 RepID=A0A3M9X060_9HYPH|nr:MULTISPECIES: type IV secretion system protein [Mesorhizobium]RNJ41255.1 conjugal transfer protein TrbL [Mesorhizobium japonicum]RXT37897.1 conjugal transfer protein TrbL [Mesorhizobium erdmanii]